MSITQGQRIFAYGSSTWGEKFQQI